MNEDMIFCEFNMFDLKQTLGKVQDGQIEPLGRFILSDLPDAVAAACNEQEIYNVRLFGLTNMVMPLAQQIEENYNAKFSNHTITVEVN